MSHEIKEWKPSVWVLRINLNEHTKVLEDTGFEQECIDKCKMFLWSAAHSPEQVALEVPKNKNSTSLGTNRKKGYDTGWLRGNKSILQS